MIANARKSVADTPLDGRLVAIALDTKGPEIRTGMLVGDDPTLEKGATLTVHTDSEWKEKCDAEHLYMDYANLPKVIKVGGIMFIDDGLISIKVRPRPDPGPQPRTKRTPRPDPAPRRRPRTNPQPSL